MFPCVNFYEGQVRPCQTRRLSILPVDLPFALQTIRLVRIQCGLIAFYAGALLPLSTPEGPTDL